ncbi:hypothetical protein GSY74_10155 [Sulfurovum sp. bin170]|uniref:acyl-CoA thioester hydrolase/BAAT C-terminal domain-containing protein n=1 Tax=Sulfurovum sp. bin170 TaxID=2695268 RepID=UPI0013DF229B|nr:acyl-CoA thioester hydrolase/BAAT C-terminal domain-containing protein [Sulfurovum sp. bin170]NEW61647.1 hypothetical protein [Sulfurovum sp. bin170]
MIHKKMQSLLLILAMLLITACSQKIPTIDGENNKFAHKFYPANIEAHYLKSRVEEKQYPLIFLLDGYEGIWRSSTITKRLQAIGYNVVTIGYFDDAGYSNNLSRVNLDDLKKLMDGYKTHHGVDAQSIGLIGRGKGAELALILGSLYNDIKMVVGVSASHVAFQSSRATLATHSSWTYKGKEIDFVAYPKLTLSAIKTIIRVITKDDDYRALHDLALEDREAVEKARIKVENINGAIYLASATRDKMWNSTLMSEEIVKRLKEKNFAHHYEHKAYDSDWFLRGGKDYQKGWSDIYRFLVDNFTSKHSLDVFNYLDRDSSGKISKNEYIAHKQDLKKRWIERDSVRNMYNCDKNYNGVVDFSELLSIKELEQMMRNGDPMESDYACGLRKDNFSKYDQNANKIITKEELKKFHQRTPDYKARYLSSIGVEEKYYIEGAKEKVKQCDENNDSRLTQAEATSTVCKMSDKLFTLSDSNGNGFISIDEVLTIPNRYIMFRFPLDKREPLKMEQILGLSMSECDTNYDGELNLAEVTTKACGFTKEELLGSDFDGDGVFSERDIERIHTNSIFNEADIDKDGSLNLSELMGSEIGWI